MILYDNTKLDWENGSDPKEKLVRDEITEIKNKYFRSGEKKVCLLYPRGEPRPDEADGFNVLKMFPIPLNSANGRWRWTVGAVVWRNGNPEYSDYHRYVKHRDYLTEKDAEFLWFLLNRSNVINHRIFIEDLEADAEKEVKKTASRAYVEFMLMDSHSPISSNHKLIREVAAVFGIKNADNIGINQVKVALKDELIRGQEMGDKFTNFDKFEELVNGEAMREAAFTARQAIVNKDVGFKDNAWWIMSGTSYDEKLMQITSKDRPYKEQVFVDEVVNNANVRDRLYSALGKVEGVTVDKLRELDRTVLMNKYADETGEKLPATTKKEEAIEKLCGVYGIEYK